MQELPPVNYDQDDHQEEQLRALALELGFVESPAMVTVRAEVWQVDEYQAAERLFIQYRELAEHEIQTPHHDSVQGLLAQIGLFLGMAALYWENRHFGELEEYFFEELENARMAAANLPDEVSRERLLEQIDAFYTL